jgi:hypothetical protein
MSPQGMGAPPAASAAPPGAPTGPMGPAPGGAPTPQINPAFVQWMQANQKRQAIIAQNQQKQAQFDAACALIRQDGVRGFKLDIEADSTIAPDEQAEKQSRIEFLQQIVPFMEQIVPIAQGSQEMSELMSQIAMFAVRGFRVARPLEEAFETAFKVLGTMPPPTPKGQGKQQDPQIEMAKVQADVQDTQVRAQTDMAETQSKAQIALATLGQKQQQAQQEAALTQMKTEAEQQHNAAQLAVEMEKMHSTERLQSARQLASEARGAGGLV